MEESKKGLYIPQSVLEDWNLGSTQKIIYAIMMETADKNGICRESSVKIGRRLGKGDHTICASRRTLIDLGYLENIDGMSREWRLMKHREADDG